jgi:hypothetical protein
VRNQAEIKALFFALKGGSPGTEIVFLNQNLPIRPASIIRGFHAHLLVRWRVVSSTS